MSVHINYRPGCCAEGEMSLVKSNRKSVDIESIRVRDP
jgi:hypothetical protein